MLQALSWAALGTGFTFLMTTLGAAVVFFFVEEPRPQFQRTMLGFAAGVMTAAIMLAASVWSLLLPAIEQSADFGVPGWLPAAAGLLLAGLWACHCADRCRTAPTLPEKLPPLLGLLAALLLPGLLLTDYGTAGVVIILLFRLTRGGGWRSCLAQAVGLFVVSQYMLIGQVYLVGPFEIQQECFALLALPFIWLYNGQHGRKNKALQHAAYAFYPAHLLVLGMLFMAK